MKVAKNILFLLALFSLLAGIISREHMRGRKQMDRSFRSFEKVLHGKMDILEREFAVLADSSGTLSLEERLDQNSLRYQDWANQEGLSVFCFVGEELTYWSDHSIGLPSRLSSNLKKTFLPFRNVDYVPVWKQWGDSILVGLVEIRRHYPIQNKYLENDYHRDFHLSAEVNLEYVVEDGCLPVSAPDGTFLFSLDFREAFLGDRDPGPWTQLFFLLAAFLLLFGLFTVVRNAEGRRKLGWFWAFNILLPLAAFLMLNRGLPEGLEQLPLFQPDLFAGDFFSSLGHLAILTVAVLGLMLNAFFNAPWKLHKATWVRKLRPVILLVLAAVLMLVTEYLMSTLVLDSGISFQPHKITSLSSHSILGVILLLCWFLLIALCNDRALTSIAKPWWQIFLAGFGLYTLVFALAHVLNLGRPCWICLLFLAAMLGAQIYLRHGQVNRVPFSRIILVLIPLSIFLVFRLMGYNQVKLDRQKEVELVKYAAEHDPVAEMLFGGLSRAIRSDSLLSDFFYPGFVDIDPLVSRLTRNYFSGYWTKYEYQVAICRPDDDIYLEPPDDSWQHCYSFFDELISAQGMQIPGSDFYFLDSPDGRINYLGIIPYEADGREHKLYITLYSKILKEELGYPELLLDEQYSAFTHSGFAYARYFRDELITNSGDYPFRRSPSFYTSGEETFEDLNLNGWDLNIYNMDGETTVIVGSPQISMVDKLISFAYVFAFVYLLVTLGYLLSDLGRSEGFRDRSFKHRIQYSMVVILFLSFALICTGTIYFIIQQYKDKNNDNMRNTMRSVYIELIHKVEYEADLANWSSDKYYDLDELLRKFSNVFYSDINLYDGNGRLLATSRAEIFDRHLLSLRMNRLVYEQLSSGRASEVIHNEHIGGMVYTSAYVPLLNSDNQVLAFLNLPYFTQSEALTQDVTNMVVAVVNIYLILLLVLLGVSVILSDRITQPLRVLQSRIAHVSLSEKNENLFYERNDEIRGLVEEYNVMVQELERSAVLLARSERESAWREMAKQIAHEIKNPLTPMKLNVQHLQRTLEEGKADPERVERISNTLIEQIDSLTAIANEFSDFAKMPRARNEKVNLVSKLKNLMDLFEGQPQIALSLDAGKLEELWVNADKEQLMRVFINLVKNAQQSIPKDRKGSIKLSLSLEGEDAVVGIADNGKGIPEEIRDQLFRPNFTTKSSGMGMGLAISANIVRSLGGRIWYETEVGRGTTFLVALPAMVDKS